MSQMSTKLMLSLPAMTAAEALILIEAMQRLIDAVWASHGEAMSEELEREAERQGRDRVDSDPGKLPF